MSMQGGVRKYALTTGGVATIPREPGLKPLAIRITNWVGTTCAFLGQIADGTYVAIHDDAASPAAYAFTITDNVWMTLPAALVRVLSALSNWQVDSNGDESANTLEVLFGPVEV